MSKDKSHKTNNRQQGEPLVSKTTKTALLLADFLYLLAGLSALFCLILSSSVGVTNAWHQATFGAPLYPFWMEILIWSVGTFFAVLAIRSERKLAKALGVSFICGLVAISSYTLVYVIAS